MKPNQQTATIAWHTTRARQMMTRLLAYRGLGPDSIDESKPTLAERIAADWQLSITDVVAVTEVIQAFTGSDKSSYYRSRSGAAETLAINIDHCESFHAGAEFPEYASFADDPVIGSRWVANADDAMLMTLGHELAHHVAMLISTARHENITPHGNVFQSAYRLIREHAVNPMLDANGSQDLQRLQSRHEFRLLRKLRALKQMAEDDRSNQNEAERAVTQLANLLQKHGIDDVSELDKKPLHFIERHVPVIGQGNFKALLHIAFDVAHFCGVEALIHSTRWLAGTLHGDWDRPPAQSIGFFGAPADVEMAVYLSQLIEETLQRELDAYRGSHDYKRERANGRHPGTLNSAFRSAYILTLQHRLRSERKHLEDSWHHANPTARALVEQRAKALREALQTRYPRTGTARQLTSGKARSRSANKAGRNAAGRFNLNRPVANGRRLRLPRGSKEA